MDLCASPFCRLKTCGGNDYYFFASVSYGFAFELQGALAHDIQRERDFNYTGMDMSSIDKLPEPSERHIQGNYPS